MSEAPKYSIIGPIEKARILEYLYNARNKANKPLAMMVLGIFTGLLALEYCPDEFGPISFNAYWGDQITLSAVDVSLAVQYSLVFVILVALSCAVYTYATKRTAEKLIEKVKEI